MSKIIVGKFFLRTDFRLLKVGSSDEISSVSDFQLFASSVSFLDIAVFNKVLISLSTIVFQSVTDVSDVFTQILSSFLVIRFEKTVCVWKKFV